MEIEVRHLRYFLAVAEELHFGRAAERVHIAQPALSQQIQRLEGLIGAPLFERNRRSVKLTAAGDALRPYAQRVLEEVAAGAGAARRAAEGEIGHLTVGFIETAASTVVPLAVRRFRSERPEVGLTLRELSVGAQVDGLRAGRLDVGIMRPPVEAEELTVERIADERLVAAVGAGHRLAGRTWVAAGGIAREPLVALSREVVPGLYDQVLALIREGGGTGRIAQEATSIQAVLGLVAAGLGIALLPESVRSLSRDGVAFVAIRSEARSPVFAARRADDRSPLAEAFVAAARSVAGG